MADITLVTTTELPEPDVDEAPLLAALKAAGVDARMAAWNEPDVDWAAAPLTVVRSTWDYASQRPAFLAWLQHVGAAHTVLRNPVSVIGPNTHKSYLATLERAGIPTVPTRWFTAGGTPATAEKLAALPWRHVICKPAIGGGSSGVRAFDLESSDGVDAASAHVTKLQETVDVLVQPRLQSIVDSGEQDIVWIDGEFTHVVTKLDRMAGDDEHATSAREPTAAEITLATRALRTIPAFEQRELLYARVDVAADELGTLRVVELELTEPSLFLTLHEPALDRFVASLARACGTVATSARS